MYLKIKLVLLIALSFVVSGCVVIERSMDVGAKVMDIVSGELKKDVSKMKKNREANEGRKAPIRNEFRAVNSKNNLIEEIQTKLVKLGYAVGSSGSFDAKTESAIQDFQLDNDLMIDGKPSKSLLRAINAQL